MKWFLVTIIFIFTFTGVAFTDDVYVNGYYRKNGTYVRPHYRTKPDGQKWNNYGRPGRGQDENNPGWARDQDGDGVFNQYDFDDNNDGMLDDSSW